MNIRCHRQGTGRAEQNCGSSCTLPRKHIDDGNLAQEAIGSVVEDAAHRVFCGAHDALHTADRRPTQLPLAPTNPNSDGIAAGTIDHQSSRSTPLVFLLASMHLTFGFPRS